MKNLIKIKYFFLFVVLFVGSVYWTKAYLLDTGSSVSNSFVAATWTLTPSPTPSISPTPTSTAPPMSGIVINEFMPDPIGSDNAIMPGGEWIELFNMGSTAIDINGWRVYDASNAYIPIISGNVAGGSTFISAGGYLLLFRNGYSMSLNNSGSETISLYNGESSASLIDSVTYSGSTENKTWSKVPDGTGPFTNGHTPTPGGSND